MYTVQHVDTYADAYGVWAILRVSDGRREWTKIVMLWRPAVA